jgi:hypothetical protein
VVVSWEELTHEQRVLLVNASELSSLSWALAGWRPVGVATEDEQLDRIDELINPLLTMVDDGWISAVRQSRTSTGFEKIPREELAAIFTDGACWDCENDFTERCVWLVFAEHGARLWKSGWASSWHKVLRIT